MQMCHIHTFNIFENENEKSIITILTVYPGGEVPANEAISGRFAPGAATRRVRGYTLFASRALAAGAPPPGVSRYVTVCTMHALCERVST